MSLRVPQSNSNSHPYPSSSSSSPTPFPHRSLQTELDAAAFSSSSSQSLPSSSSPPADSDCPSCLSYSSDNILLLKEMEILEKESHEAQHLRRILHDGLANGYEMNQKYLESLEWDAAIVLDPREILRKMQQIGAEMEKQQEMSKGIDEEIKSEAMAIELHETDMELLRKQKEGNNPNNPNYQNDKTTNGNQNSKFNSAKTLNPYTNGNTNNHNSSLSLYSSSPLFLHIHSLISSLQRKSPIDSTISHLSSQLITLCFKLLHSFDSHHQLSPDSRHSQLLTLSSHISKLQGDLKFSMEKISLLNKEKVLLAKKIEALEEESNAKLTLSYQIINSQQRTIMEANEAQNQKKLNVNERNEFSHIFPNGTKREREENANEHFTLPLPYSMPLQSSLSSPMQSNDIYIPSDSTFSTPSSSSSSSSNSLLIPSVSSKSLTSRGFVVSVFYYLFTPIRIILPSRWKWNPKEQKQKENGRDVLSSSPTTIEVIASP